MTTTLSPSGARRLDSFADDEETTLYDRKRRAVSLWTYGMVDRIMSELTPAAKPNVFATPRTVADPPPPWVENRRPGAPRATAKKRAVYKPHRSAVLWLVFAMSFGIAFGLGRDPKLRAELVNDAKSAWHAAMVRLPIS